MAEQARKAEQTATTLQHDQQGVRELTEQMREQSRQIDEMGCEMREWRTVWEKRTREAFRQLEDRLQEVEMQKPRAEPDGPEVQQCFRCQRSETEVAGTVEELHRLSRLQRTSILNEKRTN